MSAHFSAKQAVRPDISLVSKKFDKAITRLPWYLFAVREFMKYGVTRASSDDIAHKVGVKSWVVRRDLSQFGEFGRPSLGYELSLLQDRLARVLHLDTEKNVIWIGASRLSADKSLVQRFMDHNHRIVAVFDTDLSRVPEMVGGLKVQPVSEIAETIEKYDAKGAVLATSAEEAQGVADILVAASVFGILNLTSTLINVPAEICVRNVDVVAELFSLSYYCGELHGAKSQQA